MASFRDNFVIVNGLLAPKFFETNRPTGEHHQRIKDMELREDDILLCTFPKSGTHWLWEVTSMLLKGKVEYETRSKIHLMLEAVPVELTDSQESPRIINTHLPASFLPKQTVSKRIKIIHVYRNPKDVLTSFYFFASPNTSKMSIQGAAELIFFNSEAPKSNYNYYLKEMSAFVKQHPEVPYFLMSYEGMKKDPVSHVSRLATFLGLNAPKQLIQDIAEACSFKKMKETENNRTLPKESAIPDEMTKQMVVYRKGEVGDWKNYLTVALSERVDEMVKTELSDLEYTFQYTL